MQKNSHVLLIGLLIYCCSTLVSMAVMSLGVGALLLCLGVSFLLPNRLVSWKLSHDQKTYLRLSTVLALVCTLSLIQAKVFPLQYAGQAAPIFLLKDLFKLWYLFFPILLATLMTSLPPHHRFRVVQSWIFFSMILSVIGIGQFFTGWPRAQEIPNLPGHFHATLFFGHHLSTASILIFPVFVSLALWQSPFIRRLPSIQAHLYLLPAGFGLVTLFLTWSRTLWVALPLGLILFLARYLPRKTYWTSIAALLGIGLLLTQLPIIQSRLHQNIGVQSRIDLWKANQEYFRQRPLLGVGWRKSEPLTHFYFQEKFPQDWKYRFVGHAHNNFLEMLGGTGILGTLAWGCWAIWVTILAWRKSRSKDLNADLNWGIFCALIVFHINGITQVNFWEGKVLHQLMWSVGLLLMTRSLKLPEEKILTHS